MQNGEGGLDQPRKDGESRNVGQCKSKKSSDSNSEKYDRAECVSQEVIDLTEKTSSVVSIGPTARYEGVSGANSCISSAVSES